MPNNETSIWILKIVEWIEWYEYANEVEAQFESECPDHIKDDPTSFMQWANAQKRADQQKYK